MALFGQTLLIFALAATIASIVLLWLGHVLQKRQHPRVAVLLNSGYILTMATTLLLTLAVALLFFCFFSDNNSLEYVAHNQSDSGWLFMVAGLWGGRQGSLLFWAWLISLFTTWIAYKRITFLDDLSSMAIMVSQLVQAAFVGVLVFSAANNPFLPIDPAYLGENGELIGPAVAWGMNTLLEHWAMAIHPPTLFVGYAGLTIPFAYAVAALIVDDPSKRWVEFSTRITVLSWLMLGVGIGLGAVWAYVVLGWGGYWAWDPVENASLLPWLVGVALLHTSTVYRKRGAFKRWAVMCACLTFGFVILGTFIERSGIVESVHAFEGDPVSFMLFLGLILASVLAGVLGLVVRWKSFASNDEIVSLVSKDAAYYFNNAIMIIAAVAITYMTVSSALPEWLWFGGQKIGASTYNALARPLGILYCLILAACPLLGWGKTQGREFLRKIRIPALIAVVLFAALLWIFTQDLLPIYNATLAAGTAAAEDLAAGGSAWYYNGLALVAFIVAALIVCNTVFMFIRGANARKTNKHENFFVALLNIFRKAPVQVGGYISHLGIAIILVGLVGSSMYVSETAVSIDDEKGSTIQAERYTLTYEGNSSETLQNGNGVISLHFSVTTTGERYLGTINPGIEIVQKTQQQKAIAGTLGLPTRDIFVVFNGVDTDGKLSVDVKVNPLISFVWVGFGLLIVGPLVSTFAKRRLSINEDDEDTAAEKLGEAAPAEKPEAAPAEKLEAAPAAAVPAKTEAAPAVATEDAGEIEPLSEDIKPDA
ncbi:MAG: cytochrome c biogenesis protein CcsA [Coriobacteriales bacterium]|jgi:cytochrome c-type biogenesis protein CcmF|nr:cytochrome c biogenesis protein CcsA [Coriobacteriales bacterium]